MNNLFVDGARALVIVAHPDDETIWFGGTMLAYPKLNWTILVLSRASDHDRAPKFAQVAKRFGAHGLIEDWDDEGRLSYTASVKDAKHRIKKVLAEQEFDYLFTHGVNGEYGHDMHKACHQAVKELLADGKLSAGLAFAFNYKKISKYQLAPKADSDLIIKLSKQQYQQKKAVMSELYGFNPKGIDVNYCTKEESFKIIKY